MKAIETVYNGYRFRSRLEARWAVFFDMIGIKYQYEHEGFDLGEAGWYLPDFWLPESTFYVEVKSSEVNITQEERMKIDTFRNIIQEEYEKGEASSWGLILVIGVPTMPVSMLDETINESALSMGDLLSKLNYTLEDSEIIEAAVNAARQARFEYGNVKQS